MSRDLRLADRFCRLLATGLAIAFGATAMPAFGAVAAYETAVLANNPYAFYRQQDAGIGTGSVANSIDVNNRDATYQGSPVGGATGAGLSSDAAVIYGGVATGTAGQYFGGTNLRSFGASLSTSSYEFVFKVNPGFTTDRQSLFGVFNTGSTTAVEVTLNSLGNDAVGGAANINSTRLFIRGDDGDGIGVHFNNPTLYDGNYHHLVFTFDRSTLAANTAATLSGGFAAYVDGIAQSLTFTSVNSGATDANFGPDSFTNFNFDPTFLARNVRTTLGGTAVGRQANVTLDEAALYAHVLTPAQVAANYAAVAVPEISSSAMVGLTMLGLVSISVYSRRREVATANA